MNVSSETKLKDDVLSSKFDDSLKKLADRTRKLEQDISTKRVKSVKLMVKALQESLLQPKIVSNVSSKSKEKTKNLMSASERALKALKTALDELPSSNEENEQIYEDGNDLLFTLSLKLDKQK